MAFLRSSQVWVISGFIFIALLAYMLAYYLVLKENNIVFNKPVIFEGADQVEAILQAYFYASNDESKSKTNLIPKPLVKKAIIQDANVKLDQDELLIIYFWKKFCPCNLAVSPHFNKIVTSYVNEPPTIEHKVRVKDQDLILSDVTMVKSEKNNKLKPQFYIGDISNALKANSESNNSFVSSKSNLKPFGEFLPASLMSLLLPYIQHSPSIVIMSKNKGLLYYGPHQLGFLCNAESSIVTKVIKSYQQDIYSKNTNVLGEGCFCK